MGTFEIWLRAWIFSIAFILFVISAVAYTRSHEKRIGMVSMVLLLFTLKGLLLSLEIFFEGVERLMTDYSIERIIDLAILVFLLLVIWGIPRRRFKGEKG